MGSNFVLARSYLESPYTSLYDKDDIRETPGFLERKEYLQFKMGSIHAEENSSANSDTHVEEVEDECGPKTRTESSVKSGTYFKVKERNKRLRKSATDSQELLISTMRTKILTVFQILALFQILVLLYFLAY